MNEHKNQSIIRNLLKNNGQLRCDRLVAISSTMARFVLKSDRQYFLLVTKQIFNFWRFKYAMSIFEAGCLSLISLLKWVMSRNRAKFLLMPFAFTLSSFPMPGSSRGNVLLLSYFVKMYCCCCFFVIVVVFCCCYLLIP